MPSFRRDHLRHRLVVAAMALLLALPLFAITAVAVAPPRALAAVPTLEISVAPALPTTADSLFNVTVTAIREGEGGPETDDTFSELVSLALSGGDTTTMYGYEGAQNAVAGVATFEGLAIRDAGDAYVITASAPNTEADVSTDAFDVAPGAVASVEFATQPSSSYTADDPITVVVSLEDDHGNAATNADDDVTVALSTSGLGGTTSKAPVAGVATFNDLTVRTVGTGYALTASYGDIDSGGSESFAITPGALDDLVFTTIGEQTAGVPFSVTIKAYDKYDNLKTNYHDTATLSGLDSSPGCLACSPSIASSPASMGMASFTSGVATKFVTAFAADTTSQLTATDEDDEVDGSSNEFVVTDSGALADFVIDAIESQVAGVAFSVTATAYDTYGNKMTSYDGTPVLSGLDPAPGCASCAPAIPITNAVYGTVSVDDGIVTVSDVMAKKVLTAETVTLTDGSVNAASAAFEVTPGALGDFVLSAPSDAAKTAGVGFQVTATVYDQFGNLKTDYDGTSIISGNLGTAPGLGAGAGDDSAPDYGAFTVADWSNGQATATVTAFLAESLRTITVSDGSASDTSPSFTVNPAAPADLKFSVPHLNFNGQPIDTKVNTPIYSVCGPTGPSSTVPCSLTTASTTATTGPSTGVRVLVRDAFGNPVANGVSVSLSVVSPASGLGPNVLTVNGIANFGDNRIINTLGTRQLRAQATGGTNPQDVSTAPGFVLVNDLKGCSGNRCENRFATTDQKAFNAITAGSGDFFGGGRNVLLRSRLVPTSDFQSSCANLSYVGQGSEVLPIGAGVGASQPSTVQLIVISKDVLKRGGITSRNAASFNVCIGAKFIGTGTAVPWKTKSGANAQPAGGEFWGVAADCSARPAGSTDPCVILKTKQASAVQQFFGWTAAQTAQVMRDSDIAIIVREPFPWDPRGIIFK